jgi:MFS family permease
VFIGLLQRGVELFFPAFLVKNRGFTPDVAALVNSSLLLFAVLGQLVGGWASDRYSPRRALATTSAGIVAGMLALVLSPWPVIGVGLFVFVFGFSFYGHQPTATSLLGIMTPPYLRGAAYGVMFFFAFGLGSVSATVSGYLADSYGLDSTFQILSLFALAAFTISLLILKILEAEQPHSG